MHLKFSESHARMRLENLAGAISRIVIENKIARNKWIIMVKEKRQQPFFVPAERVKMNGPVTGVIWHDGTPTLGGHICQSQIGLRVGIDEQFSSKRINTRVTRSRKRADVS